MKKKKSRVMPLVIAAAAVVVVAAACAGGYYLAETKGKAEGEPVQVTVEKGSSSHVIADQLKEAGVIDSTFVFRLYLKNTGRAGELQYGTFELQQDMPYEKLVDALAQKTDDRETVTVTFPEGITLIQFAQRMEQAGLCTQEEFIDAAVNGDYSEFAFFSKISSDPLKFMRTEGFLFPDTYTFFKEESVESMVRKIYQNFDKKVTPDLYARMDELGLSLEETITLASFVQEEAGDPINMNDVSAVLHNRLAEGSDHPRLECEVSWRYIYDFIEPYYGGEANTDPAMIAAYDTYSLAGLPVGPISNPGLEAIKAALYPTENSPYYYFVTDEAGTYYYAVTFAEHNANIAKAKQVNASLGK